MCVVIAGALPLGRALATTPIEAEHDVGMIDDNREKLDRLAETLDRGFVEGDRTLPSIPREAGGDKPEALMALTNADEDNILCAIVGRSVGYKRGIPQIIQRELSAIRDELKLEDVITPHETVAANLVEVPEGHAPTESSVHLTGALRLAEFSVCGSHIGQEASGLDCGPGGSVIAVHRGEHELLPGDAGKVRNGDVLVLVVQRSKTEEISVYMKARDSE